MKVIGRHERCCSLGTHGELLIVPRDVDESQGAWIKIRIIPIIEPNTKSTKKVSGMRHSYHKRPRKSAELGNRMQQQRYDCTVDPRALTYLKRLSTHGEYSPHTHTHSHAHALARPTFSFVLRSLWLGLVIGLAVSSLSLSSSIYLTSSYNHHFSFTPHSFILFPRFYHSSSLLSSGSSRPISASSPSSSSSSSSPGRLGCRCEYWRLYMSFWPGGLSGG